MSGLAKFGIEVLPVGYGRISVNGEDVTERVAGFRLLAAPGEPTLLVLHLNGAGEVTGEGIVQSIAEGQDPTRALKRLNAEKVLANAAETFEGEGSYEQHIMNTIIEALDADQS